MILSSVFRIRAFWRSIIAAGFCFFLQSGTRLAATEDETANAPTSAITPSTEIPGCEPEPPAPPPVQYLLALPWACQSRFLPPVKMPEDQARTAADSAQGGFWLTLPWQDFHANFITAWGRAATPEAQFRLIEWCRKNRFPEGAEFILRHLLKNQGWEPSNPLYRRAIKQWIPCQRRRRAGLVMGLPVGGEWFVVKDLTKHHQGKDWAAFAVDLVIKRNNKPFHDDPAVLENHYAYDQPVLAVADGVVAKVVDNHPDTPIGEPRTAPENLIIIAHAQGVSSVYAHLGEGTACVKPGDQVHQGDKIGRVGNSGASGIPHLHFDIYDQDYLSLPGRFRFESRVAANWTRHQDAPLAENTYIRPLPAKPVAVTAR